MLGSVFFDVQNLTENDGSFYSILLIYSIIWTQPEKASLSLWFMSDVDNKKVQRMLDLHMQELQVKVEQPFRDAICEFKNGDDEMVSDNLWVYL